ncbi:MAG: GEGP motif-containing diheme protein [Syntrophobacteraceae bacterium]
MKARSRMIAVGLFAAGLFIVFATMASVATAAYKHAGDAENDATVFLNVYPDAAGTKLDNCALCHGGGAYTDSKGKTTIMGSCQYCHAITNYGALPDQYGATLNVFGKDFQDKGRNEAALYAIEALDSDGDGYANLAEITAVRYPGLATDDPTKVAAPSIIFDKAQLEAMPQHSQFMIMNTTKSGDYYVEYSGVVMANLLKKAGIRADATKITVYAPDGFAITHPIADSPANLGLSYAPYVNGLYPRARYYYDTVADKANGGWCDYTSPGTLGRIHGAPIQVAGGLRMILALRAEGKDLVPGYLDETNRIASGTEGPFRTVTPQKLLGPPDQPSTNSNPALIWPYNPNGDHNAGFSSKCATIIKVEPLPEGTTDIDVLEAGWNYVDTGKIVIYGDIDPRQNIIDKLSALAAVVKAADADSFRHPAQRNALALRINKVRSLVSKRQYDAGLSQLEAQILPTVENCSQTGTRGAGDWVTDCDLQQNLLWSLQEIVTLLEIVA